MAVGQAWGNGLEMLQLRVTAAESNYLAPQRPIDYTV
jgi:hypothetical protein